jgi:hypothetical protein
MAARGASKPAQRWGGHGRGRRTLQEADVVGRFRDQRRSVRRIIEALRDAHHRLYEAPAIERGPLAPTPGLRLSRDSEMSLPLARIALFVAMRPIWQCLRA